METVGIDWMMKTKNCYKLQQKWLQNFNATAALPNKKSFKSFRTSFKITQERLSMCYWTLSIAKIAQESFSMCYWTLSIAEYALQMSDRNSHIFFLNRHLK